MDELLSLYYVRDESLMYRLVQQTWINLSLFFCSVAISPPTSSARGPWPRNRQRQPKKLIKDCVSLCSPSIPIISQSPSRSPSLCRTVCQRDLQPSWKRCSLMHAHMQAFKGRGGTHISGFGIHQLPSVREIVNWSDFRVEKMSPVIFKKKKDATRQNEWPWLLPVTLLPPQAPATPSLSLVNGILRATESSKRSLAFYSLCFHSFATRRQVSVQPGSKHCSLCGYTYVVHNR